MLMLMTAQDLHAPYAYVSSEELVRQVVRLLMLGRETGVSTSITATESERAPRRSLMELEGLGKEIWEGVDAAEYIRELRDEWNHR